ncbi:MAG: AMP-binding protein [Treponema sp.]|nr:AMP-binding protein [Treponema sp.]
MKQYADKTLADVCLAAAEKYGDRAAFAMFMDDKICRQISYRMMGLRARQFGLLLIQLGITPGDRILLLAENCPEWPVAYFGIAMAGAVSVPLLTGFSSDQTLVIAGHAEVSAVIASREMSVKIKQLTPHIPMVYLDSLAIPNAEAEITVHCEGREKQLPLPVPENNPSPLPRRKPEDLAAIIYTSGTLGNSKGVMLSHANIIFSALSSLDFVKIIPSDRLISVLPLAHAYECSLGMIAPVISGAGINYLGRPPSASVLLPAAKALRPTAMITVPLFIEKMYRLAIAPKLVQSSLHRCPLTRPLAVRFAGRRLKKALGGKIRFFGIGGAPLFGEVETFLRRARFPFAVGYGLTEAAPLVAGTSPHRFPFRSTGVAVKGAELRITANVDADAGINAANGIGEIQVRGPNVMMGYYRDEAKTREAFSADGWLRTGDLGSMDSKGKLYVRGRIKALILGPGGENIYPEEIEGLLGTSSLIEESLVYSGEKGELVAMVRLTDAAKTAASVIEHMLEELRAWANKKLSSFSRITKIVVRHEPFEKTPTLKIKRNLYA